MMVAVSEKDWNNNVQVKGKPNYIRVDRMPLYD